MFMSERTAFVFHSLKSENQTFRLRFILTYFRKRFLTDQLFSSTGAAKCTSSGCAGFYENSETLQLDRIVSLSRKPIFFLVFVLRHFLLKLLKTAMCG